LIATATALLHPDGKGIAVLPEGVPINACEPDPVGPEQTNCPESFIPQADAITPFHPEGKGIAITPAGLPMNGSGTMGLEYPATCPELLIPPAVNPFGNGSAVTVYV
jgi:hypothetical protein